MVIAIEVILAAASVDEAADAVFAEIERTGVPVILRAQERKLAQAFHASINRTRIIIIA